ncbi:MAG TPA: YciI family protein [Gemmataceae bacterium]|nr:YciI family protein [Gemmataceae bacterium]
MRFLSFYKSAEKNEPPTQENMAKMGALIEEWTKAGVLLSSEGCKPSAQGFRVRRSGKQITVTDGPFTESKEVIGGFALLQAKTKEEMIEWIKKFLLAVDDGECEVRLLYEPSDFGG